jgi:uncharacterized protein (DUF488 family)
VEIHTIGFTKWSAQGFFGALKNARIERLIDVRLANTSQLAAFAKRDDLRYFLRELVGADYVHASVLAPEEAMLAAYRKRQMTWAAYEHRYLELLDERAVDRQLDPAVFEPRSVLLCSEHEASRCHRRLAAEFLADRWPGVEVHHL